MTSHKPSLSNSSSAPVLYSPRTPLMSPSFPDVSVDYMRSSGLDSSSSDVDHTWTSSSSQDLLASESPISSPSLSCPPRWIFEDAGPEHKSDTESDEATRIQVPYSSSPPDLYASQSNGSENTQSRSSEFVRSVSAGSQEDTDYALVSRATIPPLDAHADGAGDSFGQQLHQLLLHVLRDREEDRRATLSEPTLAEDRLSPVTSNIYSRTLSEAPHLPELEVLHSPFLSTPSTLDDQNMQRRRAYTDHRHLQDIPEELSPMKFVSSQELRSDTENTGQATNFRIIKRARSYALFKEQEKETGPSKRRKTCGNSSMRANEALYARRTASLRRADSLRVHEVVPQKRIELVPTVPTSPVFHDPQSNRKRCSSQNVLSSPVPVIAPPLNYVAKLPLTPESLAKRRLISFLKREIDLRAEDGLPSGICLGPPIEKLDAMVGNLVWEDDEDDWEEQIKFEWEAVMGLEAKTREAVVDWLLKVLPELQFDEYNPSLAGDSPSPLSSPSCSNCSTSTGSSSSSYESETRYYSRSAHESGRNLLDQLQTSPETRFHAVWMFLRYFYLAMPDDSSASNPWAMKILRTGNFLHNVWAIAVACLAISVKFHRDFLDPLIPVFTREYLSLAPYPLNKEKLEAAHRDVLGLFGWRLGVSPQPIMEELWFALPSLRTLLDFASGWKSVMERAWSHLFKCLIEPDVQRHPVSVLTATALMKSIVRTLVDEYDRKGTFTACGEEMTETSKSSSAARIRKALLNKAREEAEGVFCDIQALIEVTDVDLLACRTWMSKIKRRFDSP